MLKYIFFVTPPDRYLTTFTWRIYSILFPDVVACELELSLS